VAAYLPLELFRQLRDHAEDRGLTVSDVIVEAVRSHLGR